MPPDHDNDHAERIAVLETKQDNHGDRIKALEDRLWWAVVTIIGGAGTILWQAVPTFLKGMLGK